MTKRKQNNTTNKKSCGINNNKTNQQYKNKSIETLKGLVSNHYKTETPQDNTIKTGFYWVNGRLLYKTISNMNKVIIRNSDKTPLSTGLKPTEEKKVYTKIILIYRVKPRKRWFKRVYTQILKYFYPRDKRHIIRGGIKGLN